MLTFELILVVFGLLAWSAASAQSSDQDIVEHFRRGEDFLKQEQFEQAIGEFKRVLRLRPGLVEAEINIGLAYHSLCDYQLAVDHLSRGLRQKPDLLAPNVLVGIDYLKLGSAEKAVPFLERALKLDPANQQARRALASSGPQESE